MRPVWKDRRRLHDDGEPVTSEDLKGAGAMTVIMREAIKPNLLQTIENTRDRARRTIRQIAHWQLVVVGDPHRIHTATSSSPRPVSVPTWEASAFRHQVPHLGLKARRRRGSFTVRALRSIPAAPCRTGGHCLRHARGEPDEVHLGGANLRKQIENIQIFGVSPVVRDQGLSRRFPVRHEAIREIAASMGVRARLVHLAEGGKGASSSPELSSRRLRSERLPFPLPERGSLRDKIETVATRVYGAAGVDYLPAATARIGRLREDRLRNLPVIIAKTHLSLSSDSA